MIDYNFLNNNVLPAIAGVCICLCIFLLFLVVRWVILFFKFLVECSAENEEDVKQKEFERDKLSNVISRIDDKVSHLSANSIILKSYIDDLYKEIAELHSRYNVISSKSDKKSRSTKK